ncbi:MAG: hypothetical protein Q8P39_03665 [Candidatus Yanofskybacteria bacterium]|nr:hypothetical protein [Candidatus Yanofskybacteria bacterium]
MKHRFLSLALVLIIGITIPAMSLAQEPKLPQTADEAKELGSRVGEDALNTIKQAWEQDALPILFGMWTWSQGILWDGLLYPLGKVLWDRALGVFRGEVEKRSEIVEQEFEKKKEELKEDLEREAAKVKENIWERIQRIWNRESQEN